MSRPRHSVRRNDNMPSSFRLPHVDITAWRILNFVVLVGLGIFKTVETYRGNTAAATVADWALGLVMAFILYLGGLVEQDDPEVAPWLFQSDLSRDLRRALRGVLITLSWIVEPFTYRRSRGPGKGLVAIFSAFWIIFAAAVSVALSTLMMDKIGGWASASAMGIIIGGVMILAFLTLPMGGTNLPTDAGMT
ncbi:hypothetical protein B0H13DRAFT_2336402 [Mycena leptocephala]|nr:hypothetical protein B0H13DRAFT_2336402 [Mycena leptocephala]